tara:strand:+ start:28 stop:993 length:966 start_codon:yes stop_codon:yes gene_type:complete
MKSIFFFKKNKVTLKKLFPKNIISKDIIIDNVRSLNVARKNDLSFFDKPIYSSQALNTNAGACITTENLKKYLNKNTKIIVVKNVLYELAIVLNKIYLSADIDYPDLSLKKPIIKKYKTVKFGNNVLVGKNVQIGKNSIIGSNSIIEHDVKIGKNCIIGSGVIIKNSVLGDRAVIQDNCKIGLKGFGFIPIKNKNIKFPHIGRVLIFNDVEIGSGCTIDRGSIDDTIIGSNSYLDNQVHIAHNVKIGSNCMIAGQVGFAGSSIIGDNVSIGGQAGISGHLRIGNNVKIGGGSGVVKNIQDNEVVMGYPAVAIKDFIKNNKK